MKKYELIHEIYNLCDGHPDSRIQDVETDDLDGYMKTMVSKAAACDKMEKDGSVVYEVVTNGVKETFTFTEV